MNSSDKWIGSLSHPANYQIGQAFSSFGESKLQAIYEGCKGYVVKLFAFSNGDKTGNFFNGFFYGEDNLILTSGHVVGYNGADTYEAWIYKDGALEKTCELKLLHKGSFVRQDINHAGVRFNVFNPDVAVLEYNITDVPLHPQIPFAVPVSAGSSVCIVGYRPVREPQLSISEGIISYSGMEGMLTTAYADDGYSGSPVLSSDGYLAGMVKGGVGTSIKQVEVVDARVIHYFLLSQGLPGFKG